MAFIIKINYSSPTQEEYYSGKTYTHQGFIYPVYAEKSEAKRYIKRGIAQRACDSLNKKCEGIFSVEEAEDED